MDWSYVAGIFDGEGYVSLGRAWTSVHLTIGITNSSPRLLNSLVAFLTSHGIRFTTTTCDSGLGLAYNILIDRWSDGETFLAFIYPHVIEKLPQVRLARRIIALHGDFKRRKEPMKKHLAEFDFLRRRLHSYARKGRKTLKPWPGVNILPSPRYVMIGGSKVAIWPDPF